MVHSYLCWPGANAGLHAGRHPAGLPARPGSAERRSPARRPPAGSVRSPTIRPQPSTAPTCWPPHLDLGWHPAFINIWPTGQRWDRASYLKYWATAFDPKVIVYWDVRDELITVIGDVALVRATNKHTRRRDGQEVTGMTMYTDTYLFENGAWKCIQAQLTAVAPEHQPADDTIVSVYIEGKRQERRS